MASPLLTAMTEASRNLILMALSQLEINAILPSGWNLCLLKRKTSLMFVSIASVMAEAYILINCELGSEDNVIKEHKIISGVAEVKGVFGVYDIIARVRDDLEFLDDVVFR